MGGCNSNSVKLTIDKVAIAINFRCPTGYINWKQGIKRLEYTS